MIDNETLEIVLVRCLINKLTFIVIHNCQKKKRGQIKIIIKHTEKTF